MKLYREVKTSEIKEGGEFYDAKKRKRLKLMAVNPDKAESIYLLPIEITEEEIEKILREKSYTADNIHRGWVIISANSFEDVAEVILSKLKGDE